MMEASFQSGRKSEPPRVCIPDPAALAQGHRLWRFAGKLERPAWIAGALALLVFGMTNDVHQFAIVVTLLPVLAWLRWHPPKMPVRRARAGPRLSDELHGLLLLVEGLSDALERGEDRRFHIDAVELVLALDALGPDAQRYLDERGADRGRLRHGVCGFDPEAELDAKISADCRRALHHELLRFAAAARGRPCGDPYRSPLGDGPALLTVIREPALARTRRRLAGLLVLIGLGWVLVSQWVAALRRFEPMSLCNPWRERPGCELPSVELPDLATLLIDLEVAPVASLVVAVALVPVFLLVAALASREAAWHSWAASLPITEALPRATQGSLARARRRERAARGLWWATAWLYCGFIFAVPICATDWGRDGFTIGDRIIVIEFLALALVGFSTLLARLEHRRERQRLQLRMERAPSSAILLTELFELRREIEHAPPVCAELLEQAADLLERADVLGRLPADARDQVVARLRAGTARAPAISREQCAELLLDLCGCEALLSHEINPAEQGLPAS